MKLRHKHGKRIKSIKHLILIFPLSLCLSLTYLLLLIICLFCNDFEEGKKIKRMKREKNVCRTRVEQVESIYITEGRLLKLN